MEKLITLQSKRECFVQASQRMLDLKAAIQILYILCLSLIYVEKFRAGLFISKSSVFTYSFYTLK